MYIYNICINIYIFIYKYIYIYIYIYVFKQKLIYDTQSAQQVQSVDRNTYKTIQCVHPPHHHTLCFKNFEKSR